MSIKRLRIVIEQSGPDGTALTIPIIHIYSPGGEDLTDCIAQIDIKYFPADIPIAVMTSNMPDVETV